MLSQFLAECAAVQAEHGCGMALIVLRVLKYGSEKRLLDLSLHHFIQLGASLTFRVSRKCLIASSALSLRGGEALLRFWRLPGCARDAEGDELMRRVVPR
ncbi:MAG: hypothetical protein CM15mP89_4060 [Gammaproteobacteria bacterium]|nr:MAG: hypothetical protein CM15mP89_4060 [Gammaproteobacteria bacterium]